MQKGDFDRVRNTVDIEDYVQRLTGEQGRGGRTKMVRCPKHSERTPSFAIDTVNQTWHCYGECGCGGDIFALWTWINLGVIESGALRRLPSGDVDPSDIRIQALQYFSSTVEVERQPARSTPERKPQERTKIDQTTIERLHGNRALTLQYFGKVRMLSEPTIDKYLLGTAIEYPHRFFWGKGKSDFWTFNCRRYSIPWMKGGKAYMVNYRRDDEDCKQRLEMMDQIKLDDIRAVIGKEATDQEIIRAVFGDKYKRNFGSNGYAIFNLDTLYQGTKVLQPMEYCIVNEAEISAISVEEAGYPSVAAKFTHQVDFQQAFSKVRTPILLADNDGGTGYSKAKQLKEAIGNPRSIIKTIQGAKDANELWCLDRVDGSTFLKDLIKSIGVAV